MDETVLYYDLECRVGKNPYYYLKPGIRENLYFCQKMNGNLNVLWSMGTEDYVMDALTHLDVAKYFSHIMTRNECDESLRKYGANKSALYLADHLGIDNPCRVKTMLIDDKAYENSKFKSLPADMTYTHVLQPPPFDAKSCLAFLEQKKNPGLVDIFNYLFTFYTKYHCQ